MKKSLSPLVKKNGFVLSGTNVYCRKQDAKREFAYSDGEEVERRLRWIFTNAADLSSASYELQEHISDWPSEYHLSPVRANLLRALDLSACSNVLELGCGCGSITRYLGEQTHLQVDAVEGSAVRAELAAMRCRDLDNVTVSTANFNDIEYPEHHYDLVLFVGVTEYAGRFSDAQSDEQALQDLLAQAKKACKPDGAILIAIENRTGMKYVMGANEDHYAKPYIGIHNYAQPAGIKTYTRREWQQQLALADLATHEFIYPFPDYKIPTVFLHEDYVQNNRDAYVHLEGIRSRDYVQDFGEGSREVMLWEAASTSGTLSDYANSFLILASASQQALSRLSRHDFVHLPGFSRKAQYCMKIAKPKVQEQVVRQYVGARPSEQDANIQHKLVESESHYQGKMLSVEWARALISYPDKALFYQYLKDYFEFLSKQTIRNIDLLPSNIIINQHGEYQGFDEEWQLSERWQARVSAEFVYYRAVLLFYCQYPDFIEKSLADHADLTTIGDWIKHAFDIIERPISNAQLHEHYQFNDEFQKAISWRYGEVDFDTPLQTVPNVTILHWRTEEGEYSVENHLRTHGDSLQGTQTFHFDLPYAARVVGRLLVHPMDDMNTEQAAFFRIYSVTVKAVNSKGEQRSCWQLDSQEAILQQAKLMDLRELGKHGRGLYVDGADPRLEFVLPQSAVANEGEHFRVELTMDYPRSEDYMLAKSHYIDQLAEVDTQLTMLDSLRRENQQLKQELQLIRQSRSWHQLMRLQAGKQRVARGVHRAVNHVKNRLGDAISSRKTGSRKQGAEKPLSPQEQEVQSAAFDTWLQQRPQHYWCAVKPLSEAMTLQLILLNTDDNADDWYRCLQAVRDAVSHASALGDAFQLNIVLRSQNESVAEFAKQLFTDAPIAIQLQLANDNRSLSELLTDAAAASGDTDKAYVTVLTEQDVLLPHSLAEYALTAADKVPLADKGPLLVYADDVRQVDNEIVPYFKPTASPELLAHTNYLANHFWVHARLLQGPNSQKYLQANIEDSAGWHALVQALFTQARGAIRHIAKPLAQIGQTPFSSQVLTSSAPELAANPLVSIILPFRDSPNLLQQCLRSLLDNTSYENFEVIGVSNGSISPEVYEAMQQFQKADQRVRFIECNAPFNFAKLINVGAAEAKGEHLLLLNNDIEIVSSDWCEQMLAFSQRDDIGAVGAKLLYPDHRIQHAGIALGVGSMAAHVYKLSDADLPGYFDRLQTVNNVMAVTGAMLMVKKALFDELGGLNEERYAVAFNDIDFCLRLWQNGLRNVWTPHAEAIHYESISRGYEDSLKKLQRFETEKQSFMDDYRYLIDKGDPYYNPNLSRDREDYYWQPSAD